MEKLKTSDFDYQLPEGMIAQQPLKPRDSSRLMVIGRNDGSIQHKHFHQIKGHLLKGDVLVFNESRVIPARLVGEKEGGGKVELLLLRRQQNGLWQALAKPGRRVKEGNRVVIGNDKGVSLVAEVIDTEEGGIRIIRFSDEGLLSKLGETPLPPYIKEPLKEPERYQTVYSRVAGSVAAPTAGLHFTPELLDEIRNMGVSCLFVNLHIGLDTFRPVTEEDPQKHPVHREYGIIDEEVAGELNRARDEGRRIICVGTSTVRLLENVAKDSVESIKPFKGWVDLLIFPGHSFKMVDGLLTNFHLPRSTLLMLVSAFAGRERIKEAYTEAISKNYRFYSFGDAMLIV